ALHRARAEAQLWRRRLRAARITQFDDDTVGLLLALAYPDRIAQQRTRGRFQLRNGAVALIDAAYPLAGEPMLAVGAAGGHGRELRVYHAAPVSQQSVEQTLADRIERRTAIQLDDDSSAVRAVEQRTLGALVLATTPLKEPPPGAVTAALLDLVRRRGLDVLPWTDASRKLRQRLAFLHAHDP